jgi:excisionase family DNA binding protein
MVGTKEAATRLGIVLRTVYRLIDEGELPAYKMGSVLRIKSSHRLRPGDLRHLYPPVQGGRGQRQPPPAATPPSLASSHPPLVLLEVEAAKGRPRQTRLFFSPELAAPAAVPTRLLAAPTPPLRDFSLPFGGVGGPPRCNAGPFTPSDQHFPLSR